MISVPAVHPHVHNTGEIGMIRLIGMENIKAACVFRCSAVSEPLADALEKERNVYDISAQLSAKPYEVAAAVEKLKAESLALEAGNERTEDGYFAGEDRPSS